jgi:hypothetical protein
VGGHRHGEEFLESLEAELENPWGLLFDAADVANGVLAEAGAGVEGVSNVIAKIALGLIDAGDRVVGGFGRGCGESVGWWLPS